MLLLFTLWVRATGGSSHRAPLSNRNSGGGGTAGFILYITPGGTWSFWTGNGSSWNSSNGPAVSYDVWTFVAGVYDGNEQVFYINGEEVDRDSFVYAPNTTRNLRLGFGRNESSPSYYFKGDIDEVQIYNRALSENEVLFAYQQNL